MENRIIKFRAWDIEKEIMYKVLSINLDSSIVFVDDGSPMVDGVKIGTPKQIGDQVKLMQYTGKTDRNNKDIYEGDILIELIPGGVYKTGEIYLDGSSFFLDSDKNDDFKLLNEVEDYLSEVIGNIHEKGGNDLFHKLNIIDPDYREVYQKIVGNIEKGLEG